MDQDIWLSLPDENLMLILEYFELSELAIVKLICKRFYYLANDQPLYAKWWQDYNIAGELPQQPHLWLKNFKVDSYIPSTEPEPEYVYNGNQILVDTEVLEAKMGILVLHFNEQPVYQYDGRDIDPQLNGLYHQALLNIRYVQTSLTKKYKRKDGAIGTPKITKDERDLLQFLSKNMERFDTRNPPISHKSKSVGMIATPVDPDTLKLNLKKRERNALGECKRRGMCFAIYLHSEPLPTPEDSEATIVGVAVDISDEGAISVIAFLDMPEVEPEPKPKSDSKIVPVAIMGLLDNFIKIIILVHNGDAVHDGQTRSAQLCKGIDEIEEYKSINLIRLSTIPYAAKLGLNHKRQMTTNWYPTKPMELEKNISPYAPEMSLRVRDYQSLRYFMRYLARYGYYFYS